MKEDIEGEKEEFKFFPHRGLSDGTLRFYNIKTRFIDDVPVETGFIHPNKAVKIRRYGEVQKKDRFYVKGEFSKNPGLFGQNFFDPGSKESVTICEGVYDSPTIYQITAGNTAAVSVLSTATAKRDCIANRDWINSFPKIILCFDNDEQGRIAESEVARLFDFTKVYRVRLSKFKDPNEYLQNGEFDALYKAWKAASKFSPDSIISSFSQVEKALNTAKEDTIASYPFSKLEENLYGLHKGEVIVIKAQEGVGKTEFFRAMEHHILKTSDIRIGILHMEENNATTIKGIATYELEIPAVLPDCGLSNEDIMAAYRKATKDDENRVHIHSSFDVQDENDVLDNIRFLVSAAGCGVVFLDHITWLATGLGDEDERRKLDRISQKLKLLAMELGFCLIMISHVNDDGKTRGSRNIQKVANTIISLTRDVSSGDNIVDLTIEKARLGGRTGPAGVVIFDTETYTLKEPKTEF